MTAKKLVHHELINSEAVCLGDCYVLYKTLIVEINWNSAFEADTQTQRIALVPTQRHAVYQQELRRLLKSISIFEPFEHVLVFCAVEETVPVSLVTTVSKCVTDVFSEHPVTTLYNNSVEQPTAYNQKSISSTILGINYFGTVAHITTDSDFTWKCTRAKAFWLVGKSTKHDRLSLLYYLTQQQQTLTYLTYSFDPEYCSQSVKDPYAEGQRIIDSTWYPDRPGTVDYKTWADFYTNQIGDIDLPKTQYHGLVYDVDIYRSHCCEIVTETFFKQPWFLTEKIHRSIALGYPFLTLGDHFSSHLRSLGYLTFDDLLDQHPLNQGQPDYLQMSCKKLATLIKKFCMSCANPEFEQQVQARIAHNKKLLESQVTDSIFQISKHTPAFADIIKFKSWTYLGQSPAVC